MSDARVYNLDDYRCSTEVDDNIRDQAPDHDEFAQAGRLKKSAMVVAGMALMAWAVLDMVREEGRRDR